MSYNNNFSYFNAPTSNNEWWGTKETKKPTVFEDRGLVKIDYNNQPYAQNYMQNYAQSMILPSENRSVDPIHPRHEVLQGTVTQLFSAFGYVNDNIIFSKSDVSGPMVKVGDRVAVDATYQPNNPTKYKGERVCKIDDSRFNSPAANNLSKMKPLSKDISTRIDIPLTTYRPEVTKFEPPKKPEPKPPVKKFEKPIELSPIRPTVVAKEVIKPPEPKRIVKAISPIDLTRSERSRSNSSRKNSRKISPPLTSSMKRRLKRSAKRRSPSETKSSKASKPADVAKSDKQEKPPALSSAVTTVATVASKVVVDKLPKQQESFSLRELDCSSLKFRCKNLQPPSQFFHVSLKYQSSFPLNHPMKLGNACHFKVMDRKVTSVDPLVNSLLHRDIDPDDADTTFSAKVMLLSTDDLASFYKNTLVLAEEFDGTNKIPITKAIKFLVGSLGQNKEFAFGGAWSPSLDGHDPDNNPQVLINTAIRTCKNITGIDLSGCSSWPKFLELHYYRPLQKIRKRTPPSADRTTSASSPSNCSSTSPGTPSELSTSTSNIAVIINSTTTNTVNGPTSNVSATNVDKTNGTEQMEVTEERFEYIEPRMETVVYYVPDIWNCVTSQEGWNELKKAYQEQLTSLMCPPPSFPVLHAHNKQESPGQQKKTGQQSGANTSTSAYSNILVDNSNSNQQQHQEEEDYSYFNENEETEDKTGKDGTLSTGSISTDEQPSHFSNLHVDSMKIVEIKKELDRRKLSNRGVMDQLKARLKSALEKEESEEKLKDGGQGALKSVTGDSKTITDTVLSEAEKAELKQFYMLPDTPHIIVHHNVRFHGTKMRIKTMSLHSLLSYYDMKLEETAFEVALFAKQFLEMLRRDAVFNVYKSLVVTPEADFAVTATDVPPAKKAKLLVTTSKRTVNRPLLFSCVILDREKTGKIALDDLKGMIEGLGICLSSDQLTNLLGKVQDPTRGLNYRLLTDKEIDDCELSKMLTLDQTDDLDYIRELAMGNKALFEDHDMPVDMHPGDYDEIDRLKNELDKSERCRQNLELRFSELREETEKNKTLVATQVKEIARHKDQSADYRSRYHREQDRSDHYKKDLEKLHRDLKTVDKMSGVLGKAVLECLERCKKSTETPKLPVDSKSKAEDIQIKSKGGRASSTSSSSVGKGTGKVARKLGGVLTTTAAVKLNAASASGSISTGSATQHSGIIAGNDEDCANAGTGNGQDNITDKAVAVGIAGGIGSSKDSYKPLTAFTSTADLDVELLGSSQHDIVLEADVDVDDVLLRSEDDELCLLPGDEELCLLPGDEDDLDILQTVDDDNDLDDGDVVEVQQEPQEQEQQEQHEQDQEHEQEQCEKHAHSPVVLEDDDDDDEQDQEEHKEDKSGDKSNDMTTLVEQDAVDDKDTDDVVMTDDTSSHCQITEQVPDSIQEPQPDQEMDQDQDLEDFDFSKPMDYEIIILDETE